jgi:hypothetical protein
MMYQWSIEDPLDDAAEASRDVVVIGVVLEFARTPPAVTRRS